MTQFQILISDGLHENGQAILRTQAEVANRNGITAAELQETLAAYQALIVRGRTQVSAALLETAPQLRVVGRAGVGVDNIDLAAAQTRGVTVVNAPLATTIAVAEHTLALLFSLLRAIPRADAAMKAGQWIKKQLEGAELYGKTLGIIGMGHIGSAVAQRAAAFDVQVIGYDPLLAAEAIQARAAEPVTLNELFAQADIISLHVPRTPQTRGLINGQAIGHMKRGVYLICTARGGIIDETALLNALESGQVAGAALDVFASEPPGLTALVAHPRVVASPHIAAQTVEAQERAAVDIAQEVLAALRGEPLRWKIV
jgi:D-3-phosphoglycerate dehydrogenase